MKITEDGYSPGGPGVIKPATAIQQLKHALKARGIEYIDGLVPTSDMLYPGLVIFDENDHGYVCRNVGKKPTPVLITGVNVGRNWDGEWDGSLQLKSKEVIEIEKLRKLFLNASTTGKFEQILARSADEMEEIDNKLAAEIEAKDAADKEEQELKAAALEEERSLADELAGLEELVPDTDYEAEFG